MFGKGLWTLAICTSLILSVTIIYLNIRNWESQPAVVTNVGIVDIEVGHDVE